MNIKCFQLVDNNYFIKMEIIFILIEPSVPENIGASIRAINTMGFKKVRLVNPQCDHLDDNAFKLAHGSYKILREAKTFDTFNESIKDIDFVIGTTNKERISKNDYYNAEEILPIILEKKDCAQKIGIVFGRESRGMDGDEILQCNILSSIPMANPYPTLNLSQSVMLYAYTLSKINFEKTIKESKKQPKDNEFKILLKRSSTLLENSGLDKSSNIYNRIMERLALVGGEDVRLFHSVLNLIDKKIKPTQ